MLINLAVTIALSCPACGRLEKEKLNIFDLPVGKLRFLNCSCGAEKASLLKKKNLELKINYFCLHCNTAHQVEISHSEFWYSKKLNLLSCKKTGLNLGFYGPPLLINEELKNERQDLELMAAELGFDDFKNPAVMLQALDFIHDTAADKNLSCECGSDDISVELFSAKIQLICNKCSGYLNLSAANKNDLINLRQLNKIKLPSIQGRSNSFY